MIKQKKLAFMTLFLSCYQTWAAEPSISGLAKPEHSSSNNVAANHSLLENEGGVSSKHQESQSVRITYRPDPSRDMSRQDFPIPRQACVDLSPCGKDADYLSVFFGYPDQQWSIAAGNTDVDKVEIWICPRNLLEEKAARATYLNTILEQCPKEAPIVLLWRLRGWQGSWLEYNFDPSTWGNLLEAYHASRELDGTPSDDMFCQIDPKQHAKFSIVVE